MDWLHLLHPLHPQEMLPQLSQDQGPPSELDGFVTFVRTKPGRIFKGDRHRHQEMLTALMMSKKYTVLRRSVVEGYTNHRYLALDWVRQVRRRRTIASGGPMRPRSTRMCCRPVTGVTDVTDVMV